MEELDEIKLLKSQISQIIYFHNVSEKELTDAVKLLGRLNAMAYKGYGPLSYSEKFINDIVYTYKDKALKRLISLYKMRNMEVGQGNGCVYFRGIDGIQVSFHCSIDIRESLNKCKWDMVMYSYEYNYSNKQMYDFLRNLMEDILFKWKKNVVKYQYSVKKAYLDFISKKEFWETLNDNIEREIRLAKDYNVNPEVRISYLNKFRNYSIEKLIKEIEGYEMEIYDDWTFEKNIYIKIFKFAYIEDIEAKSLEAPAPFTPHLIYDTLLDKFIILDKMNKADKNEIRELAFKAAYRYWHI